MRHGASFVPRPLLTSKQLAEMLGLTRKGLYHAVANCQVPTPIKVGNRLRWRPEDVEQWLDDLAEAEAEFRGER